MSERPKSSAHVYPLVSSTSPSMHTPRASLGSSVDSGNEPVSTPLMGTPYHWMSPGERQHEEGERSVNRSVVLRHFHARRKSAIQLPMSPIGEREKNWRRRPDLRLIIGSLIVFTSMFLLSAFYYGNIIDRLWAMRHPGNAAVAAAARISQSLHSSIEPFVQWTDVSAYRGHLCDYCDCQVSRSHPPLRGGVTSAGGGKWGRDVIAAALISYVRDSYCHRTYISEGAAVNLLRSSEVTSSNLNQVIQWNLAGLELELPTAYAFTKTASAGRTRAAREDYFRRHIHTFQVHQAEVRNEGWLPETLKEWGPKRQTLWIVVEDGSRLEDDVAEVLATSSLPYIYFAFGPTRHFGNAQQNAAYSLIRHLSDPTTGVFGPGPIVSIDDDANILPILLRMIWKVKKIGVWPMGNLGPTHWEGPVYDDKNNLVDWVAGATSERKFPIDNGAFTFRSELLGTVLPGPKFWPTDFMGGESEFISKLVSNKEEVEPICYNCHVAWHNEPLPAHCVNEPEAC